MSATRLTNQRRQRLEQFLLEHAERLTLQGAVVASYRSRGTKRTGPYFKMTCRDEHGRQRSVYLGPESPLMHEARSSLATLQRSLRTQRILRGACRAVQRELAALSADLAKHLAGSGLYLKGAEIRGWSQVSAVCLLEAATPYVNHTRAAEAPDTSAADTTAFKTTAFKTTTDTTAAAGSSREATHHDH